MSYHKLKLPGIDQLYRLEPLRESIVQGDVGEVLEKIRTHFDAYRSLPPRKGFRQASNEATL